MKPKVSIITSIYKGRDFLFDFLLDVKRQSIFPDLEVLLLDANEDGDDADYKTIKPFLPLSPFKYHKIGKCNVYKAWNLGIDLSTSDYLSNWNIDDRRSVRSLKTQSEFLDDNLDIDVCYGSLKLGFKPNENFEFCSSTKVWQALDGTKENLLIHNSPHALPMWRKSIHNRFGKFNSSYFSAADYDMWFRVLKGGGKLGKIDDLLGVYYENPNSISRKKETLEKAANEVMEVRQKYS